MPNKSKKTRQGDYFTQFVKDWTGLECVKEFRFHPVRRWRFDYAIPEFKIAVEVEGGVWTGGRHVSPKGFLGDMEKYNAAAVMGWKVLRCTPKELNTARMIEMIRNCIYESEITDAYKDNGDIRI